MPLTGLLYDSRTNSFINFNGQVHVIARWKQISSSQTQVDLDVNLPTSSVTVTTDTGIPYNAYGAGQSSVFLPPNPVFPNDPLRVYVPSFWLALPPNPVFPNDPIQPSRLLMQFDLVFSAAGVLDFNTSTAQFVQFTEGLDFGDG